MKSMFKLLGIVVVAVSIVSTFIACEEPATPISLVVKPGTASVARGGTQQFSAVVSGLNNVPQDIIWSVEGPHGSVTSISSRGILSVDPNETVATIIVRATSKFDENLTGASTITVKLPTVTSVTVNPAATSVARGGTRQFSATVNGTNDTPQNVIWSLSLAQDMAATGTSISSSGVLWVDPNEMRPTITVCATSTWDSSKSGTVSVGIEIPTVTSVTVSPVGASIARGGIQNFTATVAGLYSPPSEVIWSLSLAPGIWTNGNISSTSNNISALYSFGVIIGNTYYVWWNDSNQGNSEKTLDVLASAAYNDGTSIFADVDSGYTTSRSFTSDRNGTVTIRISPTSGGFVGTFAVAYSTSNTRPTVTGTSISSGGVLSVDANEIRPTITVRATSTWDSSKSGTVNAAIQVPTVASVTVNPASATVIRGGTQNFSATVTGTYSPPSDVIWSLSLAPNNWTDGSIDSAYAGNAALYSFDVTNGTTYYVWWNDSLNGSGKTLDVLASAAYSDSSSIFADIDSGYTTYRSFIANRTGTVTIKIVPKYSGSVGTFAVAYNISSTRPTVTGTSISSGGVLSVSANETRPTITIRATSAWDNSKSGTAAVSIPVPITLDVMTDGNIDSSASGSAYLYSLNVVSGTTYYVWWNDLKNGNSTKSLDVNVNAAYIDGTSIFANTDAGWATPKSFTANRTGTVILKVSPYTNGQTGTFAVVCSNSSTRPIALAANIWTDGNIAAATGEDWYSFPVTSGTTYRIWWNDSKQGDYTKTGDIAVSARYENVATYIFGGTDTTVDYGYTSAQSFTANQTGTVLVRVIPYYRSNVGSYSLVYSTSSTRPALYTVTFDVNNGSGTVPAAQTVSAGLSITLPSGNGLSRSGYIFDGWNTNASGTGTNYNVGSSYTPTATVTLYARWLAYTVTFNINSGSGTTPAAQMVSPGSSITLPNGDGFTRSGYIFNGWNTNSSGTGTDYSPGFSYTPIASVTLYAKWLTAYTVTFNINSGSGTVPATQTVSPGLSINLPDGDGFTRSGYTFDGWNTSYYGTGTNYDAGSSYTPTASITLYARWLTNYTVTFDINNGSGTIPAAQTVTAGLSIILPDGDGLTRGNLVFGGWNTNASGTGTNYDAGSSYTPTASITLYARWLGSTITFSINNGSGTIPAVQTVSPGSNIILPGGDGFTRSGYIFNGWNTNSSGTGTNYYAGYSYTPTASITLYARWLTAYTVTFNINGGSGTSPVAQTISSGSSITLPDGDGFTRSGYIFNGWNTNASGTGTNYDAGSSYVPTASVTLYARWLISRTVAFSINNGSGTIPAAQTVSAGSSITLPDGDGFTRGNLVFGGWNTNASGTGTNYDAGSSYTPTASITLYARWLGSTVTFDINNGSGTIPAAQTVSPGSSITLPDGDGFTRSGYIFNGWNINSSGPGTNYYAGYSYTPTASITLYARWLTAYTVTFDINNGSGTIPAAQTVSAGSSITLPDGEGFTRSGYFFGGWNTKADGTGTTFTASTTVTGNIVVYAQWKEPAIVTPNGIELVFVPGGSFQLGKEIGTASEDDTTPISTVTLTGFYMGKYAVTQEQYQAVMGSNPSYFSSDPASGETQGKRPVEQVRWYDALVFCNKLSMMEGKTPAYSISGSTDPASWGTVPTGGSNSTWDAVAIVSGSTGYRLPTEAQWEYAAKGGASPGGSYTYAGSNDPGTVAWYSSNSNNMTHEVGKKAPNGLGLYDMSGNVNELCWDRYGEYTSTAKTDPMGTSSGVNRVLRGGSWGYDADGVRSVYRNYFYMNLNFQFSNIGFRLVSP